MLAYVEVPSNHVEERSGVSKDTGRAYNIRSQTIYLFQGEAYPEKYQINLEDRQQGYEPGRYLLAAGSFTRDGKTGRLGFSRAMKLLPLAEAAAKIGDLVGAPVRAPRAA